LASLTSVPNFKIISWRKVPQTEGPHLRMSVLDTEIYLKHKDDLHFSWVRGSNPNKSSLVFGLLFLLVFFKRIFRKNWKLD
jgi:hypothetical protein